MKVIEFPTDTLRIGPDTLSNGLHYFKRLLKEYCIPRAKTLIDIGCGHGKYSIIAHELGLKVTGVDARRDRVPLQNKNIDWKIQSVKDVEIDHDIVLLSGILYHLDLVTQIKLVTKCLKAKYIILNTHIIHFDASGKIANKYKREKLSHLITENFHGCLYHEGNNLKNRPMAAFDNEYSFWHTEKSLQNLFIGWDMARIEPRIMEGRYFYFLNDGLLNDGPALF